MTAHIDLERLYREVIPSVVSIYVSRDGPGMGSGSGFVTEGNHVVTNQHVVGIGENADDVEIRFSDGSWRTGRVVGTDVYTDLAVVSVPDLPETVSALRIATENPHPGRQVAALGNPLGLDGSITTGIVSGASRSMPTSNGFAIPDVVQTDAAINPGNSGGPLVGVVDNDDETDPDPAYEVVGVNRARQGDGIGFAVSPAIVNRVVPALVDEGEYRHSYLRTRTLDVTPTVAEANELDRPRGVLVVDVGDGTEGDDLRGSRYTRTVRGREIPVGGDVIVGIDGRAVHTHEELMRILITETSPGEPVDIDVLREGTPTTLSLVLGERPQPKRRRSPRRRGRRGGRRDRDRGENDDSGGRIPID